MFPSAPRKESLGLEEAGTLLSARASCSRLSLLFLAVLAALLWLGPSTDPSRGGWKSADVTSPGAPSVAPPVETTEYRASGFPLGPSGEPGEFKSEESDDDSQEDPSGWICVAEVAVPRKNLLKGRPPEDSPVFPAELLSSASLPRGPPLVG